MCTDIMAGPNDVCMGHWIRKDLSLALLPPDPIGDLQPTLAVRHIRRNNLHSVVDGGDGGAASGQLPSD